MSGEKINDEDDKITFKMDEENKSEDEHFIQINSTRKKKKLKRNFSLV